MDPKTELTQAKIDALKAAHGELRKVTTKRGDAYVVRGATTAEWRRFRSESASDRARANATETLVRACVVHPETAAFSAALEKQPGLVEVLAEHVVQLSGAETDAQGEAL